MVQISKLIRRKTESRGLIRVRALDQGSSDGWWEMESKVPSEVVMKPGKQTWRYASLSSLCKWSISDISVLHIYIGYIYSYVYKCVFLFVRSLNKHFLPFVSGVLCFKNNFKNVCIVNYREYKKGVELYCVSLKLDLLTHHFMDIFTHFKLVLFYWRYICL